MFAKRATQTRTSSRLWERTRTISEPVEQQQKVGIDSIVRVVEAVAAAQLRWHQSRHSIRTQPAACGNNTVAD